MLQAIGAKTALALLACTTLLDVQGRGDGEGICSIRHFDDIECRTIPQAAHYDCIDDA
jgi:hypothetical protein